MQSAVQALFADFGMYFNILFEIFLTRNLLALYRIHYSVICYCYFRSIYPVAHYIDIEFIQ